MAIGSSLRFLYHNKLSYFFIKFLGTPDLHSHIRLKPVLCYLNELLDNMKTYHILEIGCGSGVIAFELIEKNKKMKYLGLDNNSVNIESAKKLLKSYNTETISFSHLNVEKEELVLKDRKFDIILLIDVLEHLKDPKDLLKRLAKQINRRGLLIISVPTPLYPKIFGQTFHKKVGHVVNGYTLNLLRIVFNTIDSEPIFYKYNTGLFSNIGCALFYRITFMNKAFEYIKTLLLYIFKYIDFINGEKVSCSLFAVFKLRKNGMNSLAIEVEIPKIENVIVTDETLSVELSDGRAISVPLAWYPRLLNATEEKKKNWRLTGRGVGIHWKDIDEDISVKALLLGKASGESQQSLKKWLKKRKKNK